MYCKHWNPSSLSTVVFSACISSTQAIRRQIGALDPVIKVAVNTCFQAASTDNSSVLQETYGGEIGYKAGLCPNLINCIMDNLAPADSAGLSAGTTIVSLLPTILALVGAGPIELVQLAFASPIRALATCLFGVGLPSGLFRQLRTSSNHHAPSGEFEMESRDPFSRHWKIDVPLYTTKWQIFQRIVADIIIIGLAGIMLWRNWVVGSITMVTFRCEYSWLLFCWPMACILWLFLALFSLFIMSKEIRITLDGHKSNLWEIVMLPYRSRPVTAPTGGLLPSLLSSSLPIEVTEMTHLDKGPSSSGDLQNRRRPAPGKVHSNSTALKSRPVPSTFQQDTGVTFPPTPRTAVGFPETTFTVTITMRKESFWQWYETGIETVAVRVYLYATIVLGSILFLTGQSSIEFVVLMVLSLAVIRIVGTVM